MSEIITTVSSHLDKLLKTVPELVNVKIGKASKLFEMLPQKKSNYNFYLTVPYANGGGVQGYDFDSTTESLGYTASPSIIQPSDSLVDFVSIYRTTKKAIDQMGTDESIVKDFSAKIYNDVSQNLAVAIRRLFYLPVSNGILAKYTNGSSGTSITTSGTSITLDADPTASSPSFGAWMLRVGDIVDIYEGSTKKGTAVITAISTNRKTITLKAFGSAISITASATADFYLQGTYGKNFNAFGFVASESRTLHGIDSSSNAFWDGAVVDANGATSLTVAKIQELMNKIDANPFDIDLSKYNAAFTTKKQLQSLENDLVGTITVQASDKVDTVNYGWNVLVDGVRVYYDPYMAPGVVFMPHFDYIALRVAKNPEWIKDGNMVFYPEDRTKPQNLMAVMSYSAQIACELPGAQGKLYRLSGDFSFS